MTTLPPTDFTKDGYTTAKAVIPRELFESFYDEVRAIGRTLAKDLDITATGTIDEVWMQLAKRDRALAGQLYDAVKHSVALRKISVSPELLATLKQAMGSDAIGLVDLNVRIDAPNEDKFLFAWHQDYWFSICSPQAVVAWIPLVQLDGEKGGIEVISNTETGDRVCKVKRSPVYESYSNSILIDEPVNDAAARQAIPGLGDALLFKFNVLHKSMRNSSKTACRWTLQLRFASFEDEEFRKEKFRPGIVTAQKISYLERVEARATH